MKTRRRPTMTGDTGSAAIELVLVTPLLIAVVLFVVGLGRISHTEEQVSGAASDAARAASVTRTTGAATVAAQNAAAVTLGSQNLTCANFDKTADVVVDNSHNQPGGYVKVTVSCVTSLSDVALAGFPGTGTPPPWSRPLRRPQRLRRPPPHTRRHQLRPLGGPMRRRSLPRWHLPWSGPPTEISPVRRCRPRRPRGLQPQRPRRRASRNRPPRDCERARGSAGGAGWAVLAFGVRALRWRRASARRRFCSPALRWQRWWRLAGGSSVCGARVASSPPRRHPLSTLSRRYRPTVPQRSTR